MPEMLLVIYRKEIGQVRLNILGMNSDKYNVFTTFANVYPVF